MTTVLVVDDDRSVLAQMKKALADHEVITAGDASEVLSLIEEHQPDCALLDIMLPETSGLDVFRGIKETDAKLPVIFITAGGSSETAIEAMQLGAYDYLVKPLVLDDVAELVGRAVKTRRLMNVPVAIEKDRGEATNSDLLVGNCPAMLKVYANIGRVAAQDVTVLIRGESGTGKELIARALYQHSPRKDNCFMAVNCAALPDALLESELFGHEKGAFTGADSRRIGKFEQCNGGTIFLDEVGDMAAVVQSKVLRLLQEQQFERVGGNETIETDVRIITATNRALEEMVQDEEFREDLFYRLNGFTIHLPPLRERGSDVKLLIEHFLWKLAPQLGKKDVEGISAEATGTLLNYQWPGNVRELQSVVRQALLNCTGPVIVPEFLPPEVVEPQTKSVGGGGGDDDLSRYLQERIDGQSEELYAEAVEFLERKLLPHVLQHTGGNQSQAAKLLGITRGSLRNKLRTLGLTIEQVVSTEDEAAE